MHAEVVPRERQPFASRSLGSLLLILPLWQVLLAYMIFFKAVNNK